MNWKICRFIFSNNNLPYFRRFWFKLCWADSFNCNRWVDSHSFTHSNSSSERGSVNNILTFASVRKVSSSSGIILTKLPSNLGSAGVTFTYWAVWSALYAVGLKVVAGLTAVCEFWLNLFSYWHFFFCLTSSGVSWGCWCSWNVWPVTLAIDLPRSLYVLLPSPFICLALANSLRIFLRYFVGYGMKKLKIT